MSVIAWDGKTLASDRQGTVAGVPYSLPKIFKHGAVLLGYTGDSCGGEEMKAWYLAGAKPEEFPASQRDQEKWSGLLVVHADGVLWKYEYSPYPVIYDPQVYAMGSGRDFALAAMHLGKTAGEAVEVACVFDVNCGKGVTELSHGVE